MEPEYIVWLIEPGELHFYVFLFQVVLYVICWELCFLVVRWTKVLKNKQWKNYVLLSTYNINFNM